MCQPKTMDALALPYDTLSWPMEAQAMVYSRWFGRHRMDQRCEDLRHPADADSVAKQFPSRPRLHLQDFLLFHYLPYVGVMGGEVLQQVNENKNKTIKHYERTTYHLHP